MSSYSSRHNRYYDSVRSSHGGNARSQSGNASGAPDDDTLEEISEDLQKILDDDSKCARLLRKIFREDRSFDLHLQRIQEFQTYLEKSDSNKFIMKLAQPALNSLFKQLQERFVSLSNGNARSPSFFSELMKPYDPNWLDALA